MKYSFLTVLLLCAFYSFAQPKVGGDGALHPNGSYALALSAEIKGALQKVTTLTERDAIKDYLRQEGLICFVSSMHKYYYLDGGTTNEYWQEMGNNSSLQSQVNQNTTDIANLNVQMFTYSDAIGGKLTASNNLSDLTDKNAARQNLGLGSYLLSSTAASTYVAQVAGKGLSTNDYTTADKNDLAANTAARHTHSNKVALDAVTGINTGDQDLSGYALKSDVQLAEKGAIIGDHFTSLTNWTKAGTWTVSANKLNVPNGDISFTTSIKNNAYGNTNLRKWTVNIYKFIIPTISSTSYGITAGISSVVNNNKSLAFRFCTDATKAGLIEVYYAENSSNLIASSVNPLAITAGDSTSIRVQRILNTFEITWQNLSQPGKPSVLFRYEAPQNNGSTVTPPNAGKFTLYANGGASTIDSISVYDNELVNAPLAVAGTSIDVATTTANPAQTWTAQLQNLTGQPVAVFAGNSNRIEDINPAEVIAHSPKNILLSLATNNLASLDDTTTMKTKLASLVSSFTAAGYVYGKNLFISNVMPRNDFDATAYNIALANNYSRLIDVNTTFRASGGTGIQAALSYDGIHLTPEAQQTYAGIMYSFFASQGLIKLQNTPLTYNRAVYQQGDYLRVGANSAPPTMPFEVEGNDITSWQARVVSSNSNITDGLFWGGSGSGTGGMMAGATYKNGSYVATGSAFFGWRATGARLYFMGRTGTTAGQALGTSFDENTASSMGYVVPSNNVIGAHWYINPTPTANTVTLANTSIAKYFSYNILPALTSSSFSLSGFPISPATGDMIFIENKNTSNTYSWTCTASNVKQADATTAFTLFPNNSRLMFMYNGTNWVLWMNNVGSSSGTATLSGGTATVSSTAVVSGSSIELNYQNCSSCGTLYKGTLTPGTSFVINSTNASDASTVSWRILP